MTAEAVKHALHELVVYGAEWDVTWNTDKTGVLAFNVPDPPSEWRVGNFIAPLKQQEKFLSVIYTTDKKWHTHYQTKIKSTSIKFNMLCAAGLLGGANPPSTAAEIVNAMLWPKLYSGCAAANISGPEYKKLRKEILNLKVKVARKILGASKFSPINATMGELGWVDGREESKAGNELVSADLTELLILRRFLRAPTHTVIGKVSTQLQTEQAEQSKCMLRAKALLGKIGCTMPRALAPKGNETIKKLFASAARRQWRERVANSEALMETYGTNPSLRCAPYLSLPAFRGRTLLTRIRLNDLPLEGAGFNTSAKGRCPLCMDPPVETRLHFTLECPEGAQKTLASDKHQKLRAWIDDMKCANASKFMKMMNVSNKTRVLRVGNYLADLWELRGIALRGKNSHFRQFYP